MPLGLILAPFDFQGWSGAPVKIKLRVINIEPGGFLSRAYVSFGSMGETEQAQSGVFDNHYLP